MAAPASIPLERAASDIRLEPIDYLAKLAVLHLEAQETVKLTGFLRRSLYAAAGITCATLLVCSMLSGFATPTGLVWLALCTAGIAALLFTYARALRAPVERAALIAFREDLKAVLLYAGFAWGAGGWLVLPSDTSIGLAVAFTALPVGAIAALMRDRNMAFLFGLPVTALVSFASVLRPFSDAGLNAGLILIACGAIGGTLFTAGRLGLAPRGCHLSTKSMPKPSSPRGHVGLICGG